VALKAKGAWNSDLVGFPNLMPKAASPRNRPPWSPGQAGNTNFILEAKATFEKLGRARLDENGTGVRGVEISPGGRT
jgi:hypothetical protein